MLSVDRMKASLFALIRAALPRVAYNAPYIARVVKSTTSSGKTTLDVVPEHPDMPSMSKVPLFHGLPGVELTLAKGTQVLVEFSEGDPARAFVRSWAGGETVTDLGIGGADAMKVVLEPLLKPYLEKIANHTHAGVQTGGGTSGTAPTLSVVPDIAASVVRAK